MLLYQIAICKLGCELLSQLAYAPLLLCRRNEDPGEVDQEIHLSKQRQSSQGSFTASVMGAQESHQKGLNTRHSVGSINQKNNSVSHLSLGSYPPKQIIDTDFSSHSKGFDKESSKPKLKSESSRLSRLSRRSSKSSRRKKSTSKSSSKALRHSIVSVHGPKKKEAKKVIQKSPEVYLN